MLTAYSDLLRDGFLLFATFFGAVLTALVAGIAFHEFSHALVADRLGDRTARMMGRLSLNPLRHLEPVGTIFMLLVGFGWGRPVPVNPNRLKNGPEAGRAMVAAAGPISNLVMASIASLPLHLGLVTWHSPFFIVRTANWDLADYAGLFVASVIIFNVLLAVFNLLPIAPLDGFSVAVGLLPREMGQSLARLEQYGPLILMVLFILPFASGGQISILHQIMAPFINGITEILSGSHASAI